MNPKNCIKILPLGGVDEIGKNMTVIEYGHEMLIIDCGLGFPNDDLLGVNVVIPDFSYIIKNKIKVRGLIITHAHEDHIGAIKYFLEYINPNIYCTEFTAGVLETKLTEEQLKILKKTTIKAGQTVEIGNKFIVDFIHTNHSIVGSVAVAIKTDIGTIIHTGDFKIDESSPSIKPIDMGKFEALGNEGVLLLMSDSTNASREENHLSDDTVGESLEKLVRYSNKRIIISTFASNIYRMQQILNIAERCNRKAAISGRSMETMVAVAKRLGCIKFNSDVLISLEDTKSYPDDKILIICTGSQGEEMSSLYRIANGIHKQITITGNDMILLSSSTIPGNEKPISDMINLLMKRGAEVIYEKDSDIHSSGHACKKELERMILACKPKFFLPVHGEYIHLKKHQEIAENCGVKKENTLIPLNGFEIIVTKDEICYGKNIEPGVIYVNDMGAGTIGSEEILKRKAMAENGCVFVSLLTDQNTVKKVEIKNVGFLNESVFEDLEYQIRFILDLCLKEIEENDGNLKKSEEFISNKIIEYILNETNCIPMVVTTIL